MAKTNRKKSISKIKTHPSRQSSGALTKDTSRNDQDTNTVIPILSVTHRLRLGQDEVHYAGDLIDGARILKLFGDLATESLIHLDGDEGLFRAYEKIEFLAPVRGGDFIEATVNVLARGNTSRKMEFFAYKVIESLSVDSEKLGIPPSTAKVLDPPLLVCHAVGTCVTPLDCQNRLEKIKKPKK